MKNHVSNRLQKCLPARQVVVNRRIGLCLALFALCVFVTFIIRQGFAVG